MVEEAGLGGLQGFLLSLDFMEIFPTLTAAVLRPVWCHSKVSPCPYLRSFLQSNNIYRTRTMSWQYPESVKGHFSTLGLDLLIKRSFKAAEIIRLQLQRNQQCLGLQS